VVSDSLRALAFSFVGNLEVAHRFNRTQKMVAWQRLCVKRYPSFTSHNENNLFINIALGVNKTDIGEILDILERNIANHREYLMQKNGAYSLTLEEGMLFARKERKLYTQ
jgi:FixJ family two-component response regulator